jgi:hypothetical protein
MEEATERREKILDALVLRTPMEWIRDPNVPVVRCNADGWNQRVRGLEPRSWDDPITLSEFKRRVQWSSGIWGPGFFEWLSQRP